MLSVEHRKAQHMPSNLHLKDNYGKPRQDWADGLAGLTDAEFVDKAAHAIWLSAYANNNPRSDYHWQADVCYDESVRRKNTDLYQRAYDRVAKQVS